MPLAVYVLGLTVFCIGTTEFLISGLLPNWPAICRRPCRTLRINRKTSLTRPAPAGRPGADHGRAGAGIRRADDGPRDRRPDAGRAFFLSAPLWLWTWRAPSAAAGRWPSCSRAHGGQHRRSASRHVPRAIRRVAGELLGGGRPGGARKARCPLPRTPTRRRPLCGSARRIIGIPQPDGVGGAGHVDADPGGDLLLLRICRTAAARGLFRRQRPGRQVRRLVPVAQPLHRHRREGAGPRPAGDDIAPLGRHDGGPRLRGDRVLHQPCVAGPSDAQAGAAPTLATTINTSVFKVGNTIGSGVGGSVISAGLGYTAPV
jgi:hypothetical protein